MSWEEAANKITSGDEIVLTCVYSTGKKQGQLYTKKCRYGGDGVAERNTNPQPTIHNNERKIGKFTESGTIPMYEKHELTGRFTEFFSPQIWHIIAVNNVKIFK
jgi:hypothetical protein